MLLNDVEIRKLCVPCSDVGWNGKRYCSYDSKLYGPGLELEHPMIDPFDGGQVKVNEISSGLTSAGYDLKLGQEAWIFDPYCGEVINPKRFKDEEYRKRVLRPLSVQWDRDYGKFFLLPPQSYVLATSVEYLRIPAQLKGRCVGKSTYARSGIFCNLTPLEPNWQGHLTIEIGNTTPLPAMIFVGEGIAQLEFEVLCDVPNVDYASKNGIYNGQVGVTAARVRNGEGWCK